MQITFCTYISRLLTSVTLVLAVAGTPPAEAASSDQIRRFLESLDAGAPPEIAGERLNQPGLLATVYLRRNHRPLWTDDGALGDAREELLAAIDNSTGHGFNARRYHRARLAQLRADRVIDSALTSELLLTDAFLSQALHRGQGAVYPPNLDAEWQVPPAEVDAVELLLASAASQLPITPQLDALWPTNPEYWQLLQRRTEILASGEETTRTVPPGPLLKPGQSDPRVILLKERLRGPGDHTPLYDEDLRKQVTAFQLAAGLEPDGIVGENTLEILNATRVSWADRIDANLERWRWLPRQTPEVYLRVNIAAFTLRAMVNGREDLSMDVIVGKPFRRTPVFAESIKYMVLNPYWNVPWTIASNDKLPLLKRDASAEAAKGFEVKLPGSDTFVPVDTVDWSGISQQRFNRVLRQKPGSQNALGQIKFMLPNPYSIYLHDTPSSELFARQERSFSSGCIRLQQPLQLADWLLARDGHPERGRLAGLLASGETHTLHLRQPMPVFLVYFTAFLQDGQVIFRRDIYGRDRVLVDALRAGANP